jgi:hypothetical protein
MTLLIVLTVIEVALLLGVLVVYLALISQRLLSIADTAGKVAFGVRAIDSQTAQIGPAVVALNEELSAITGALPGIAAKAERVADRG